MRKNQLDYLPSSKQQVNHSQWHQIQIVLDQDQQSVFLSFDQREVAIYNYKRTGLVIMLWFGQY
jgi:hypothetical protein